MTKPEKIPLIFQLFLANCILWKLETPQIDLGIFFVFPASFEHNFIIFKARKEPLNEGPSLVMMATVMALVMMTRP